MSGPAFTSAFTLQAALRDLLRDWPALAGVDIATGPRRRDVLEAVTIAKPRATVAYLGAYRAEEGSIIVYADAFLAGAGEDAIDAARARAAEIMTEVVAAISLDAHTGGDVTIGGAVLATNDIAVEEVDNYIEAEGARLAGHGYTISATISYTARHQTT